MLSWSIIKFWIFRPFNILFNSSNWLSYDWIHNSLLLILIKINWWGCYITSSRLNNSFNSSTSDDWLNNRLVVIKICSGLLSNKCISSCLGWINNIWCVKVGSRRLNNLSSDLSISIIVSWGIISLSWVKSSSFSSIVSPIKLWSNNLSFNDSDIIWSCI